MLKATLKIAQRKQVSVPESLESLSVQDAQNFFRESVRQAFTDSYSQELDQLLKVHLLEKRCLHL